MKYIIEIAKEYEEYFKGILICGIADGKFAVDVIAREDLEELNSDYINEHYSSLQDDAYQKGYDAGIIASSFVDKSDEAYQRGLDDAWEAAKKIFGYENDGALCINELKKVFGSDVYCTADIIRANTAEQAIAKLKAYEEKQNNKIEVGDEVAFHHDDGRPDTVVVVTYIGQDGFIDGMDGRGAQYAHKNPTKWTKTGRHFDIQSILEDMRND